jgi:hypothetical protein
MKVAQFTHWPLQADNGMEPPGLHGQLMGSSWAAMSLHWLQGMPFWASWLWLWFFHVSFHGWGASKNSPQVLSDLGALKLVFERPHVLLDSSCMPWPTGLPKGASCVPLVHFSLPLAFIPLLRPHMGINQERKTWTSQTVGRFRSRCWGKGRAEVCGGIW